MTEKTASFEINKDMVEIFLFNANPENQHGYCVIKKNDINKCKSYGDLSCLVMDELDIRKNFYMVNVVVDICKELFNELR